MIEAVLDVYRELRLPNQTRSETFIDCLRRIGLEPFKVAAQAARHSYEAATDETTL